MKQHEQELIVINGVKYYPVSTTMISGTKAMGEWYRQEGNLEKARKAEMLVAFAEITKYASGVNIGVMKAYANRFSKLVTAYESEVA